MWTCIALNVKSSDVAVIVDVMGDEEGCLESVEDVSGGCGCRMSVWVDVVLVNLIEEDLCGVGIVNALHLFGKDLFAPGREINMEKDVFVKDA